MICVRYFVVWQLVFFLLPSLVAAEPCRTELTEKPPFFISSVKTNTTEQFAIEPGMAVSHVEGVGKATGNKADEISSEKFYPALAEASAAGEMLPFKLLSRGSLVTSDFSPSQKLDPTSLVQVKVLKNNSLYLKFQSNSTVLTKDGDKGFLPASALEPASEKHRFILKETAPLFTFTSLVNDEKLSPGSAIRLVMQEGKYKKMDCGASGSTYLFQLYQPEGNTFSNEVGIEEQVLSCVSLQPITDDNFSRLLQLQKTLDRLYQQKITLDSFEFNEWGLVRAPMQNLPAGGDISRESFDKSFVHYQGSDAVGTDDWMHPHTACAFMRLMNEWKQICSQEEKCIVQMGDAAFLTPGQKAGAAIDPLGHRFHRSGTCIDIRPFRKDGKQEKLDIRDSFYDAKLTRKFIEFLMKRGASPIYFNDPAMLNDKKLSQALDDPCSEVDDSVDLGKKLQNCPGHDNHIHVCLNPGRTVGCED